MKILIIFLLLIPSYSLADVSLTGAAVTGCTLPDEPTTTTTAAPTTTTSTSSTTTIGPTTTTSLDGANSLSWIGSFDEYYTFDSPETDGGILYDRSECPLNPPTNHTCIVGPDLYNMFDNDAPGVRRLSTSPPQGDKYGYFKESRLSCEYSNCGQFLNPSSTSSSISWGCFARPYLDTDGSHPLVKMRMFFNLSSNQGWELQQKSDKKALCIIGQKPVGTLTLTSTSLLSNTQWSQVNCSYNDTSGSLKLMKDGVLEATQPNGVNLTPSTVETKLSITTSFQNMIGGLDECYADRADITLQEACRICSIGIEGKLGDCDGLPGSGANYEQCNNNGDCDNGSTCATGATDNNCLRSSTPAVLDGWAGCCMGRNVTLCHDCDMPACNQVRS